MKKTIEKSAEILRGIDGTQWAIIAIVAFGMLAVIWAESVGGECAACDMLFLRGV